jgi:hypothetical protein
MVGTVAAVVGLIGLGLWMASMLAALVSLVLRFRSSRGTERQQLPWVAAGATGVAPPPGPSGAGRRLMQPER